MRRSTSVARAACAWALACCLQAGPVLAADVYVDATGGSDAQDGSSWATSVATISRALAIVRGSTSVDMIHVAAGTYGENLLVDRSNLTLAGGYPPGGGTRDPGANPTVVDGRATAPAIMVSGAGGTVLLDGLTIDGFTITNGAPPVRPGFFGAGAGVFIDEAAVALTNNVIESNVARGAGLLGAGVYVHRVQAGASRIEANVLRNNRAENGLGGAAAILDFSAAGNPPITFSRNEVTGNEALALPGADPALAVAHGGGLFVWGGKPVIASNTFEANRAESQIAADYSGQGGGIYVVDASPFITNNTLSANVARADVGTLGAAGGAVYAWWGVADTTGGTMEVSANTFTDNRAEGGTGQEQASGGAVALAAVDVAAAVIDDNVFTGNVAIGDGPYSGYGGAVYAWVTERGPATLLVRGGSITRNQAIAGGGGLWLQGGRTGNVAADGSLVENNEAHYGSGVAFISNGQLRNLRVRSNRLFDPDGDAVSELQDSCRGVANPVQSDADGDLLGDACDDDDDDDGTPDAADPCPLVAGASCAGDADGDGVADASDNCPAVANTDQADASGDGVGDACEPAMFDPVNTNAGGVWVTGDARLINLEIVRNDGQGLVLVGTEANTTTGAPEDSATVSMTNLTIAQNRATGFIMYLAQGSGMRDSILADNDYSDGFDTLRPTGDPSSPGVTCDGVYFSDGVAAMPCAGGMNLDATNGPPLFATGALGDFYLAQVASGQAADFVGVDAGTRAASLSPVALLTTRTDAVPEAGQVDLGFHYELDAVVVPQPVEVFLRAVRPEGTSLVRLSVFNPPADVTAVRWYRGSLAALRTEYSHASPFTSLPGTPECSAPPATPFDDPAAIGDGAGYYYLAVDVRSGVEGTFGTDSRGTPIPAPGDSATDLVTNACP